MMCRQWKWQRGSVTWQPHASSMDAWGVTLAAEKSRKDQQVLLLGNLR
jgi:hypothetical protein